MLPPLSTYNFSPTLAPMRKPCAIPLGGSVSAVCPKKYNFVSSVLLPSTSICKNSISWSVVTTERGVIIDETNPLSSFANAYFLNPSAARANVPKLEFEFVIDASDPSIILK